MATVAPIVEERPLRAAGVPVTRAVSLPAILAGATAAAALSLILFVLGAGLGLSALSPWMGNGPPVDAVSWSVILWVAFVAVASSGLGGYIAGRLRESWPGVQPDEVYFRDTAHGFLAWALATLVTAVALTSVMGAIGKAVTPAAALSGALAGSSDAAGTPREPGGEWSYAQPEAERRVTDAFNGTSSTLEAREQKSRELTEEARRNAARASMWAFVSLLLGAFFASLMATFGGRQRDLP